MKDKFVNNVNLRGYVFNQSLRQGNNDNGNYVFGTVNIATDNDAVNVVPVSFFANELYRSGKPNATYDNLIQIMNGKTFEEVGKDEALRVRVQGSVETNDFYNRDGNLISGKRVRGSFVHFLNSNEEIGASPATFETDMLIMNAAMQEPENRDPYMSLQGFVFNYRGDVQPVSFTAVSPSGIQFFENEDISKSNPYFGKVWGNIESNIVVSQNEEDDENVGFGTPTVHETTRTFRNWNVTGANKNLGMDDDTVTKSELSSKIAEREARLAELKSRQDSRNSSGDTGFPSVKSQPSTADVIKGNVDFSTYKF